MPAGRTANHIASPKVIALNNVWTLPDNNFGDPSHVNARGRAKVTADFLKRLGDRNSMAGDEEAPSREG